jgi:sialic acid synthase SpsE
VVFLSSPFDPVAAQLLADLGVAGFKLGSGELTNWPLVHQVAGYGRPLILSSGMADLGEAEAGVAWVRATGNRQVAILHCVSTYPAPAEACNLRAMDSLAAATGAVVGWSDHTLGEAITVAAVARGAAIIEKHLTIDRRLPGPDHAASLEPEEFARLVVNIRAVEAALGDGVKIPAACEADTAAVARKSIVAARDLPAGTVLAAGDLAVKRPGDGLPPRLLPALIGRRLQRAVRTDERLGSGDVA